MLNISSTIETDEIIMNSKYSYIIVQSVKCNNGVQHGENPHDRFFLRIILDMNGPLVADGDIPKKMRSF